MIYDKLANIQKYKGMYKNLDRAIDYIMDEGLNACVLGRHDIFADEVYMNVVETNLKTEDDCLYELHKRYLDIHIDIFGCETVQYADLSSCLPVNDYNTTDDYQLFKGKAVLECKLHKGYFTICLPDEPHMPCVGFGDVEKIKKAIIKVLC